MLWNQRKKMVIPSCDLSGDPAILVFLCFEKEKRNVNKPSSHHIDQLFELLLQSINSRPITTIRANFLNYF